VRKKKDRETIRVLKKGGGEIFSLLLLEVLTLGKKHIKRAAYGTKGKICTRPGCKLKEATTNLGSRSGNPEGHAEESCIVWGRAKHKTLISGRWRKKQKGKEGKCRVSYGGGTCPEKKDPGWPRREQEGPFNLPWVTDWE